MNPSRQPRFFPLEPGAASYPPPRVPMLPVLSARAVCPRPRAAPPSRFLQPDVVYTRNGRCAIAHALRLAGVGTGDQVLLPAYHCRSMVEPALWLGARVGFFHLRPDLTADIDSIRSLVTGRTRAIILTHYFGFPQPLGELAAVCRDHDLALIEDCAHAFFGATASGALVGSIGDYAVASTRKFFAVPDGGPLCRNPPLSGALTLAKTVAHEARGAFRLLEEAAAYGRLPAIRPALKLLQTGKKMLAGPKTYAPLRSQGNDAEESYTFFNPGDLGQAGSTLSTFLVRRASVADFCRRRRENYMLLLRGLSGLTCAQPLFSQLPEGIVPYMFPLLLDAPERLFPALKRRGIPLWRWEDLAQSDCPTSVQYRLRLVQLPCHQELRPSEIQWIIETFHEV